MGDTGLSSSLTFQIFGFKGLLNHPTVFPAKRGAVETDGTNFGADEGYVILTVKNLLQSGFAGGSQGVFVRGPRFFEFHDNADASFRVREADVRVPVSRFSVGTQVFLFVVEEPQNQPVIESFAAAIPEAHGAGQKFAHAFAGFEGTSCKKGFRHFSTGRDRVHAFFLETGGDTAFETIQDGFVGNTQNDVALGIGAVTREVTRGVKKAQKLIRRMIRIQFRKRQFVNDRRCLLEDAISVYISVA